MELGNADFSRSQACTEARGRSGKYRAKRRADGDDSSVEQTERALRHLIGVLLHRPSVRARELGRAGRGEEFVGALDALYGVRPEPEAELPAAVVPIAERTAPERSVADRTDEADAS